VISEAAEYVLTSEPVGKRNPMLKVSSEFLAENFGEKMESREEMRNNGLH